MGIESRRDDKSCSITHHRAYEHGYDSKIFIISNTFASYLSTRSSNYFISATDSRLLSSGEKKDIVSATELDSHADSPVVGKHYVVLEYINRTTNVSGFTSQLGKPLNVPVVTAVIAYDCEYSGETHIMDIHNALYFKNMEVNLVPPMMLRLAGLNVDKYPKFLARNPTEENYSIFFPGFNLRFLLMIEGIISYIPTRRRTSNELVENEVNYLIMTSNLPNWNSHSSIFRDQKHGIVDYKGIIKKDKIYGRNLEKKLLNSIATIIEQPTIDNASDSTQFIVSVAMLDDYINGFDINSINTRKGLIESLLKC